MKRRLFLAACAVAIAVSFPRAAGKRFITETDLFRFTWIADPQISPDGSTVAFVRVTVNEKENRYEPSLCAVAAEVAPRRMSCRVRASLTIASSGCSSRRLDGSVADGQEE